MSDTFSGRYPIERRAGEIERLHIQSAAFARDVEVMLDLIGVRDPYGFRPLCLGQLGDGYVIASETCALDLIEAAYVRDVAPGEIIRISAAGLQSYFPFPPAPSSPCIFELIYFARRAVLKFCPRQQVF